MMSYKLNDKFYTDTPDVEASRAGFGRGLKRAGELDERVVAMSADLAESTQAHLFAEEFPSRFVEIGIAEQNMACVAAGMARAGKIPFATSFAAFSPGRNWEQIKTTACLNDLPVKIVGSHSGLTDGPDGGTHQITEDIALMRVLPRMVVIAPGDSLEAEKATLAMAQDTRPNYLRLAREKTPIFSTPESPFEIGKAYVLREGRDITLIGTGTMTHQCLTAAQLLEQQGVSAEVLHVPTIKPLDNNTVLASIKKTGRAVSVEEAQIIGGLGGAVAELLCEHMPAPLKRLGMDGVFGESGNYAELVAHFGLDAKSIAAKTVEFIKIAPQYKPGY